MRFTIPGARALASAAFAAFAATVLLSSTPSTPAAAADLSEANQVIQIARAQVGDPYRWGATGPSSFDCSGLVIYAFRGAGDLALIGNGNYRSAAAMYAYFRDRGKTSRTTATPGDLVIWGGGSHVGIYLGGGMAISALSSGVRVHAVNAMTIPFTAYLRTGIYLLPKPAVAVVAPDPTPTLAPIATDRPQTQLSRVAVAAARPATGTSPAR